jgi:hypothetical protein
MTPPSTTLGAPSSNSSTIRSSGRTSGGNNSIVSGTDSGGSSQGTVLQSMTMARLHQSKDMHYNSDDRSTPPTLQSHQPPLHQQQPPPHQQMPLKTDNQTLVHSQRSAAIPSHQRNITGSSLLYHDDHDFPTPLYRSSTIRGGD